MNDDRSNLLQQLGQQALAYENYALSREDAGEIVDRSHGAMRAWVRQHTDSKGIFNPPSTPTAKPEKRDAEQPDLSPPIESSQLKQPPKRLARYGDRYQGAMDAWVKQHTDSEGIFNPPSVPTEPILQPSLASATEKQTPPSIPLDSSKQPATISKLELVYDTDERQPFSLKAPLPAGMGQEGKEVTGLLRKANADVVQMRLDSQYRSYDDGLRNALSEKRRELEHDLKRVLGTSVTVEVTDAARQRAEAEKRETTQPDLSPSIEEPASPPVKPAAEKETEKERPRVWPKELNSWKIEEFEEIVHGASNELDFYQLGVEARKHQARVEMRGFVDYLEKSGQLERFKPADGEERYLLSEYAEKNFGTIYEAYQATQSRTRAAEQQTLYHQRPPQPAAPPFRPNFSMPAPSQYGTPIAQTHVPAPAINMQQRTDQPPSYEEAIASPASPAGNFGYSKPQTPYQWNAPQSPQYGWGVPGPAYAPQLSPVGLYVQNILAGVQSLMSALGTSPGFSNGMSSPWSQIQPNGAVYGASVVTVVVINGFPMNGMPSFNGYTHSPNMGMGVFPQMYNPQAAMYPAKDPMQQTLGTSRAPLTSDQLIKDEEARLQGYARSRGMKGAKIRDARPDDKVENNSRVVLKSADGNSAYLLSPPRANQNQWRVLRVREGQQINGIGVRDMTVGTRFSDGRVAGPNQSHMLGTAQPKSKVWGR